MRKLTQYDSYGRVKLIDETAVGYTRAIERLALYEKANVMPMIVQTWAQMYDEGTLAVLPVKPGAMVKLRDDPNGKPVKVDCINVYADGHATYAFHDYGVRETFVDEWHEDAADKYEPFEPGCNEK